MPNLELPFGKVLSLGSYGRPAAVEDGAGALSGVRGEFEWVASKASSSVLILWFRALVVSHKPSQEAPHLRVGTGSDSWISGFLAQVCSLVEPLVFQN